MSQNKADEPCECYESYLKDRVDELIRAFAVLGFLWVLATASQGAVLLDDFRDPFSESVTRRSRDTLSIPGVFFGAIRDTRQHAIVGGPFIENVVATQADGLLVSTGKFGPNVAQIYYQFTPMPSFPVGSSSVQLEFTLGGDLSSGNPTLGLSEFLNIFSRAPKLPRN